MKRKIYDRLLLRKNTPFQHYNNVLWSNDRFGIIITNMKQIIISSLLLLAVSMAVEAQSINYIEQTDSWIYVYDDANKKLCTKYVGNTGEVVGWGDDYWVSRYGNWYYLWTAKGTKYKSIYAPNIGDVVAVNSKTFVSRYKNNWLYTFDKNGKKISSKYSSKK